MLVLYVPDPVSVPDVENDGKRWTFILGIDEVQKSTYYALGSVVALVLSSLIFSWLAQHISKTFYRKLYLLNAI